MQGQEITVITAEESRRVVQFEHSVTLEFTSQGPTEERLLIIDHVAVPGFTASATDAFLIVRPHQEVIIRLAGEKIEVRYRDTHS